MLELIFNDYKGRIILAGRFQTDFNFTFVSKFYLLFDKPVESFPKLLTSLNERYYSRFSIQITIVSSANICRNIELTLLNASYFYYYLTRGRGGRNHPPSKRPKNHGLRVNHGRTLQYRQLLGAKKNGVNPP